jgi:outer membrane protein assembly factor BamA
VTLVRARIPHTIRPLFLVIAMLQVAVAAAQQNPPEPLPGAVDTVVVMGNDQTRDYVILDEMALRAGSSPTPEQIEYDRNRVYSLGLFNRVDIWVDSLGARRTLVVEVHERWYLIPVPLVGFRDGDVKKLYAGAGLLHNNVGGKNQKFFGSVVFGYNPSADLFFSAPLISRTHQLFASGASSFSRIRNRSEVASQEGGDFDEQHFDINGSIGKRLSLYQSASFSLGYHIVDIEDYRPGVTASPDGRDAYVYARLGLTRDTRDLREYPMQGTFLSLSVTKTGVGPSDLDFIRYAADVRGYGRLPFGLTVAGRTFGSIVSGGEVPTHSLVYFGYAERIRGYFSTVLEGENTLGFFVELRYPVIPTRTVSVSFSPLPSEFSVWRLGLSAVLFGDAGTTWFRDEELTVESFFSGYGGGIDLLLPYSTVVRFSYAWNREGRGQFILDLRPPF